MSFVDCANSGSFVICGGVGEIDRIEHLPNAKAAIATSWAAILPAISDDAQFLVWKNLDRALRGQGDVDAACPAAHCVDLTQRALEVARERSEYQVAVICDHLPWNRLVIFCSDDLFPSVAELHLCLQPFRRGVPWATPAALVSQATIDPNGIRRSRPAAEALVGLVTHGLTSSGVPGFGTDERVAVRDAMRSDREGIRPAVVALVPRAIRRSIYTLATAVADDGWNRPSALVAFWGFAGLSLRSPSKLFSRFRARRVVGSSDGCATIAATTRGRVVDMKSSPTMEAFLADAARGGDAVVRLR